MNSNSHRHRIRLSQENQMIENDIESNRPIEKEKIDIGNYAPMPFLRELNEGTATLLISSLPDSNEYTFHFNSTNGYDNLVSDKFLQCCDEMINDLSSFIAEEQRIIDDSKKIINKLAEMMTGNNKIAEETEAFENGFLLMNDATKEEE